MNDTRPSGRHPVNIGHLVMGLAFLGIVGVWALIQTDTVGGDDVRWLLPVPWVLAGAAGLVATAVTGSRRYAVRRTGWAGEQPAEHAFDRPGWVGDEPAPEPAPEPEPGGPLSRMAGLSRLSELEHLGDRPAPPASSEPVEETRPLFSQPDEDPQRPRDEEQS